MLMKKKIRKNNNYKKQNNKQKLMVCIIKIKSDKAPLSSSNRANKVSII